MQIKGFYYKSKSGDVSSLNTTNIDVPDAITSTQLETAVNNLQQQIDQRLVQADIAQISTDIETLNTRLTQQEGRSLVEEAALDSYLTKEEFNTDKEVKEQTITSIQNSIEELDHRLTEKDTEIQNQVDTNTNIAGIHSSEISSMKNPVANITAIVDRLNTLESKINAIRHANVEVAELPQEATTDNKGQTSKTVSSESEVIVENLTTDTDKVAISAPAIELKGATQENNSMSLTAQGDVTISNLESSGTLQRAVSNAQLSVQSSEYVKITNSNLQQGGYNVVEIGLSKTVEPPKNVLIDNVDFGTVSNNAILVFGMQEGGVVTVSNCHFGSVSDCVRYSNRTNVKNVTFNFVNCTCDHWDVDPTWAGFMICQDYTSGSVEKEEENNLFAPEKVKVNFINCTGPYGKINTENYGTDQAHYTGNAFTDDDGVQKQLVYVWNSVGKTVNYDATRYPLVTIQ